MSQSALALAVVDVLRDKMDLSEAECDFHVTGQPPAMCGDKYVAVHMGGWSNQATEYLGEVFGIQVTVTLRCTTAGFERWGREFIAKKETGLDWLCRQVVTTLHSNWALIRSKANVYIDQMIPNDAWAGKFVEPLRFRDGGMPMGRQPDWFYGSGKQSAGLSQTLQFREARRDQSNDAETE